VIDNLAIVGCGTIGSSLSIELAKSKLIDSFEIYDFDVVSFSDCSASYPFIEMESGLLKIDVIEFYCRYLNPNLNIQSYYKKVISPLDKSKFVIDCRDNKSTNINAKIRISFDGYMLYIDSLSKQEEVDYYRYISPKDPSYIQKAMTKIITYLKNQHYLYKDFRLYNLETDQLYILKTEDFYEHRKKGNYQL
jgi:hypothetical protein